MKSLTIVLGSCIFCILVYVFNNTYIKPGHDIKETTYQPASEVLFQIDSIELKHKGFVQYRHMFKNTFPIDSLLMSFEGSVDSNYSYMLIELFQDENTHYISYLIDGKNLNKKCFFMIKDFLPNSQLCISLYNKEDNILKIKNLILYRG